MVQDKMGDEIDDMAKVKSFCWDQQSSFLFNYQCYTACFCDAVGWMEHREGLFAKYLGLTVKMLYGFKAFGFLFSH